MKKIWEKLKSLDKGTILRTILQVLVYVNQFIALLGSTSFAASPIYQWISFGVTLVITALSYWYDNDWTKFSQLARDIFDMMKDGKISDEEAKEFIENHKKENNKGE